MFKFFSTIVSIVVALLLCSCDRIVVEAELETDDWEYLEAKQRMREGNFEQALVHLNRVISKREFSPESHLEAGVIYLQQEDEPVLAIYHLDQYLQQKPDSREAPMVEELILSAKKRFATALPGDPFKDLVSRIELMETISELKGQNSKLSEEIVDLKKRNAVLSAQLSGAQSTMEGIFGEDLDLEAGSGNAIAIEIEDGEMETLADAFNDDLANVQEQPKTYEVKPGDSLYRISVEVYGDASKIQEIFQANRDVLPSVNDLRPGQILKLP